ncbi:MAG: hypothetical protein WKG07_27810 [Hymenobacter sp.]
MGDQNFLGLGHHLNNAYQYGAQRSTQRWALRAAATRVPFRNFVSWPRPRYHNEFRDEHGRRVAAARFLLRPTRATPGPSSTDTLQPANQPRGAAAPASSLTYYQPLRYARAGRRGWAAPLRLRSYDLGYENPGRLIVARGFIRTRLHRQPHALDYRNGTMLLGTVGYSVRRYYKDRYLFGFGRTEDVPTGTLLSFTRGPRRQWPWRRAATFGTRLAAAGFSQRHGYLFTTCEFGTFQRLADRSAWEQGLLQRPDHVLHPPLPPGQLAMPATFWAPRATVGFNRRPGELLQGISDERGHTRVFAGGSPSGHQPLRLQLRNHGVHAALAAGLSRGRRGLCRRRLGGRTSAVVARPSATRLTRASAWAYACATSSRPFARIQMLLWLFTPAASYRANGLRVFETARETVSFTGFGTGAPASPSTNKPGNAYTVGAHGERLLSHFAPAVLRKKWQAAACPFCKKSPAAFAGAGPIIGPSVPHSGQILLVNQRFSAACRN